MGIDYGRQYDRLYSALVTPYRRGPDGSLEVDEAQLRSLIEWHLAPEYVEAGIGLIINPEAGEVFYLSPEEQVRNIEIAVDAVSRRVPVFAGVFGLATKEIAGLAKRAVGAGADGIFALPPQGSIEVTGQWDAAAHPEVWIDVIKAMLDNAGDVPVITHPAGGKPNEPYGFGLPLAATLRMCEEIPNIVGWKMTYHYGGARIIARGLRNFERHVGVFAAPGHTFHEFLANDYVDGAVSGCFNYALEPMMEHISAWRNENHTKAISLWTGGLRELQEFIFADWGRLHIRYKTATWLRGVIDLPDMRAPMPRPLKSEIDTLRHLLEGAGVDVISKQAQNQFAHSLDF